MAKKRETIDTGPLLTSLQKLGWFRKINDTVQVGIPDILGAYKSIPFGIEVKSIEEVPMDGLVPLKSKHCFSSPQKRELQNIEDNGGVGVGIIICGKMAVVIYPHEIDENGQVNWNNIPDTRTINRFHGKWELEYILNHLGRMRSEHGIK